MSIDAEAHVSSLPAAGIRGSNSRGKDINETDSRVLVVNPYEMVGWGLFLQLTKCVLVLHPGTGKWDGILRCTC